MQPHMTLAPDKAIVLEQGNHPCRSGDASFQCRPGARHWPERTTISRIAGGRGIDPQSKEGQLAPAGGAPVPLAGPAGRLRRTKRHDWLRSQTRR